MQYLVIFIPPIVVLAGLFSPRGDGREELIYGHGLLNEVLVDEVLHEAPEDFALRLQAVGQGV